MATGSPAAATAAVNAAAAKALNLLVVDAYLKIQAQHEATKRLIQEGRKPWTRDEIWMLITQLDQTPLYRWTQFNRTGITISVAVTVVFGTACGVGG